MTDIEIIHKLKKGTSADENDVFRHLYRAHYGKVESYIINNRGSYQDAKDVYQETMINFFHNVKTDKFLQNAKVSTYVFAIAKNIWLKRLRRKNLESVDPNRNPMDEEFADDIPTYSFEYTDKQIVLAELIKEAGQKCLVLLRYFYFDRLTMIEIAEKLGFASKDVAKNQKSRCLKKLKIAASNKAFFLDNLQ